MTRFALMAAALILSVTLTTPAFAREKKKPTTMPAAEPVAAPAAAETQPATEPAAQPLRGEYAMMARELKLDDAQRAAMAQKVQEKIDAVDAWEKANAPRLQEIEAKQRAAESAKDAKATQAARDEFRELQDQKQALIARKNADVVAVLSPQQREDWQAFTLYRGALRHFAKADLTAEQEQKVRDLSREAAKDLAASPTTQPMQAREAAVRKLNSEVEVQVLNTPQREKMNAPSERGGRSSSSADRPSGRKNTK